METTKQHQFIVVPGTTPDNRPDGFDVVRSDAPTGPAFATFEQRGIAETFAQQCNDDRCLLDEALQGKNKTAPRRFALPHSCDEEAAMSR